MNMIKFHVPSTLQQDFEKMLDIFGQDYVVNFDSNNVIKAILPSINFKSKYNSNSDNIRLLRCSLNSGIKKGDYLTDSKNVNYLVSWTVYEHLNSLEAQVHICQFKLDIKRWVEEQIDMNGILINPAGYIDIVVNIPCILSRAGNYVFNSGNGDVGITPQNRIQIGLRYDNTTDQIKIGDVFKLKNDIYEIVDIDYSQLNSDQISGMLICYAQKKVGATDVEI